MIDTCHACDQDLMGVFYHSCPQLPFGFLTRHGIARMKEIRQSDKQHRRAEFREKELHQL